MHVVGSRHWVLTAALSIAVLAGCGDDSTPNDTAPNDTTSADTTAPVAIANPASEFCVAQGGRVEIVDEAGGQVGYCNLPDGTRIEEWEYFTSQTGATAP